MYGVRASGIIVCSAYLLYNLNLANLFNRWKYGAVIVGRSKNWVSNVQS